MDQEQLQSRLLGLPLGAVRYSPSTGSTNDDAIAWAEKDAPDYALVVADTQTSGRGRLQRRWVTRPGAALAFSLVLLPTPQEVARVGSFSPLGALALAQALAAQYDLKAEIKWPNDVLLDRLKVCGILVEGVWQGEKMRSVVLGIGVNVTPAAVPPPEELLYPATSVESALGRPIDRWELLRALLERIMAWRPRLGAPEFLRAWEERLAFRGEWVHVGAGMGDADRAGQVLGIHADGSLRLLGQDGEEFSVQAGEVHLRPAEK